MADTIQILTTVPDKSLAVQIGRTLVEAVGRLCADFRPSRGIYRWQGKIETASEWQCWIKTARDRYAEVEQAIRRLHPYQVPEILALPVVEGHLDYIQWLERSLVDERTPGT